MSCLSAQIERVRRLQTLEIRGSVAAVRGLGLFVDELPLPVGALVRIETTTSTHQLRGEVIGFDGSRSIVMLFGPNDGVAPGAVVISERCTPTIAIGNAMLGRVINGLGRPIDGGEPLTDTVPRLLQPPPTNALTRSRVAEALPTGTRVIDAMLTVGKGQRVGVFSGPGIGKSTLIAGIARHTTADVNVIALVGERGREVREFIEGALGPEGLARSVVIVATGDESPLMRVRAALGAATIAEFFRDQRKHVVLLMDSMTRLAQAQRQIGLTVGEQPATKGYTPSVFAMLPRLLERAGAIEGSGSITGFYAVLVEGDDLTEPVSDAARGVLDGHIVLSRRLAARGHFPAVDTMESISRVANTVCDESHRAAREVVARLIGAYAEAEELINIGAYARGSNPDCDVAIALKPSIDAFLTQDADQCSTFPTTCRELIDLATKAQQMYGKLPAPASVAVMGPAQTPGGGG